MRIVHKYRMMMTSQRFSLTAISILMILAVMLHSCADSRTYQCQKIMVIMKKMAKSSEKYRQADDIQKVLEVTDIFEEKASEMNNLKLQDQSLVIYQKGLAQVYRDYAETTRKFVEALQNKEVSTIQLMKKRVKQIGQKEQTLGEEMRTYCQDN